MAKFRAASELELTKQMQELLKNFQVSKALMLAAEKIPLHFHRLRLEVCIILTVD